MIESKSNHPVGDNMPKKPKMINTSVQIPEEKYSLLEKIKRETGTPISRQLVKGVDLFIIENEEVLNKSAEKATMEAEEMRSTIASIKSTRK